MNTPPTPSNDPPAVAAEIEAMRRAWRRRLVLAFATMGAIVAFFLIELRNDPKLVENVLPIILVYAALAAAFVVIVRWATARQTSAIRSRHAATRAEASGR